MLNHSVIMGRLTRNPEVRYTSDGNAVASFSLAVERNFSGRDGNKIVDFIDVVAFKKTAEFVERFFSKGRMVVVEGSIQVRNWEDSNGIRRRNTEIVAQNVYFADSKPDGRREPEESYDEGFEHEGFAVLEDDDDIPF